MTTYPNCKINLGLRILNRRPDGYHDLETVFVPVTSLCDELEIAPANGGETRMVQEGLALDNAPADNLCLRAYNLLQAEFGLPPVTIRLHKRIPFGSGLGGGSSDAAFTLKMLNTMFALGLDDCELERRAARLGADCPFFVRNRTAYATGIGDHLQPVDLALERYRIEVAIPEGEAVSTREAYASLDLGSTHKAPTLLQSLQRPALEWRNTVINDFEATVLPAHPAIAAMKAEMYRRGAVYAAMSGSGAAVFGLFE
ncbi:MAG: 4-(cytidine 5'-diphospho)-2-C-methyl-D-erythritol kinase [Bacteroidales bacterium]|nr:4-(cytidine 5'-diphospho)-2-C-methyl-D-erythritol kinase [Bacteroidales bacterium]